MSSAPSHTPAYGEVDLSTCEREPIHIPGAIQPHGVLIALDESSRAVMVSVNLGTMIGTDHEDALGASLTDLLGEAGEAVAQRIAEWSPGENLILDLPEDLGGSLAGREVDVSMHRSGDRVVLEIEELGRPKSHMLTYQSARSAMSRLSAWPRIDGLVAQLAMEVRELTAFDRVMVYRFDRHWNGEVVAEEKRADLNPFLGLHYPATDIPAQARRLYTINWTRLIADIQYRPVHLHPVLDPGTEAPLDLTHSTLRSVSPIHVEYLGNMGVGASMSISLVVEGELWGLVACHHYSGPHRPSQDARSAAEFLGQVASQQIAELERAEARDDELSAQAALSRIKARIAASEDPPIEMLIADEELLSLVGASGAAIFNGGQLLTEGQVPDVETLHRAAAALLRPPYGEPAETEQLTTLDRGLAEVSRMAAGALGIGSASDSWLLWFRPELPQIVDWGGDPSNKALYAGEGDEVRLSPRKSFDLWREVIRGQCEPWEAWQLSAARDLRTFMNALMLQRSREQIAVAESLQRSVLPEELPQLDGIELAVRYVSASTFQLGGDWWDAVRLDAGRVAIVIGDVAGHGVTAVAAMTQVRSALRAHLFAGESPAHALDLIDEMVGELLPDQMATAMIAVVDASTRQIELTSAGHPMPLLFHGDEVSDIEVPTRPLLGLGQGEATSTVVDVPAGATLLLYTDGLVERRGVDLHQSIERLRRFSRGAPTAATLDQWVDSMLVNSQVTGEDDTTVVAIHLP